MHKTFVSSRARPFLCILAVLTLLDTLSNKQTSEAKVRPSDINSPTDHRGLGRGYAPPGMLYRVDLWGGVGGNSYPFISRSQTGFFFTTRAPFDSGELGLSWGMFNHQYENLTDIESSTYTTNLALDWRWSGQKKNWHAPYLGLGIALPTRKLSGEGGIEGEAQLDAFQIALASRFGGLKRWLWEPNSLAGFLETGGRAQWGSFVMEGEIGAAYSYRVMESTLIESANLFIQASGAMGFQGEHSGLLIGGGYGMAPLSLAADVDQIHAKLSYVYLSKDNEYFVNFFVPIDAPAGLLSGQVGLNLVLGLQGQM